MCACVCVCVLVCETARESEGESSSKRTVLKWLLKEPLVLIKGYTVEGLVWVKGMWWEMTSCCWTKQKTTWS